MNNRSYVKRNSPLSLSLMPMLASSIADRRNSERWSSWLRATPFIKDLKYGFSMPKSIYTGFLIWELIHSHVFKIKVSLIPCLEEFFIILTSDLNAQLPIRQGQKWIPVTLWSGNIHLQPRPVISPFLQGWKRDSRISKNTGSASVFVDEIIIGGCHCIYMASNWILCINNNRRNNRPDILPRECAFPQMQWCRSARHIFLKTIHRASNAFLAGRKTHFFCMMRTDCSGFELLCRLRRDACSNSTILYSSSKRQSFQIGTLLPYFGRVRLRV